MVDWVNQVWYKRKEITKEIFKKIFLVTCISNDLDRSEDLFSDIPKEIIVLNDLEISD